MSLQVTGKVLLNVLLKVPQDDWRTLQPPYCPGAGVAFKETSNKTAPTICADALYIRVTSSSRNGRRAFIVWEEEEDQGNGEGGVGWAGE